MTTPAHHVSLSFYREPQSLKKLVPLLDRVLVERLAPELKSKGGIVLPDKGARVNTGTVVAIGGGARCESTGATIPVSVKEGDRVLLPEYGGTKVEVGDKELFLFRDSDLLAKWTD